MLLSKIQNIDYMTSLISGLFCAYRGSWRKYERASSLELSSVRAGESGERGAAATGTAHLCTSGAQERPWHWRGGRAVGGPCTGNTKTVLSLLIPQSRSPGESMPWFSPTCLLACRWPRSQKRSTQQVKRLPNWKR